VSLAASACSINRATGRLQLTTLSESQEIELGRENDAQVVAALGEVEPGELVSEVERVGAALAGQSERAGLPWTFRVLDDPTVNAFALPGGFVYVTRGLLVHLSSEHELAAVLGHEIGHVTARHGVVQLRKSRVAAASVGVFRIIDPNLRHVGGVAANTAVLALLAHSRDDEYEADALGLRYTARAGFEPAATVGVLGLLARVSRVGDDERIPDWLSTHPDPELRRSRVRAAAPGEVPGPEPAFLRRLDGVVYGDDPRDGFLVRSTFAHPRRGFAVDLPVGWSAAHEGPLVQASSDDDEVFLVVLPTEAESASAALEGFFTEDGFERGESWEGEVGGFPVASAGVSLASARGTLLGLLAFVDFDGTVMALMALGSAERWETHREAVAACFASFRRISPALGSVEPLRVRVRELDRDTTLAQLHARLPSAVDLPTLALLNAVEPDQPLAAGRLVKWVEGWVPGADAP